MSKNIGQVVSIFFSALEDGMDMEMAILVRLLGS